MVLPMQAVDPAGVLAAPGVVRGPLAVVLVLLLGGVLLWRFESLVDRSVAASIDHPLASMVYGVAAHAVLAFIGIYVASQLGHIVISGRPLGALGLWIGLGSLSIVAALGFTVVGTAIVELGWEPSRWHGLVVGALIAGTAAVIDPRIGGVIWLVVVSTGIGGPVRRWVHASAGDEL